jgi:hypothetical protein
MRKTVKLGLVAIAFLGLVMSAGVVVAADAPNMTGTWNLDVQTPSGSGTPVMVLKQEGEKLSGSYSGQLGETQVTGSIKDNKWTIQFDSAGVEIVYKGTVDGDTCKGSVDLGAYGMGTFTGKRTAK